jgi:hypothetical protein
MHTFLDSKAMAKALRTALAERHIDISHSDSLELVARQFGLDNWNVLAALIERAESDLPPLPRGWYRTGNTNPALHRMGIDPDHPDCLKIEAVAEAGRIGSLFGSLGQTILADDYRGGKVRLSAELAGDHCDTAAIWMRIDPVDGGKWLRFDNLIDRAGAGPLIGTFGWTRRTIVLDVPEAAGTIVYGALLKGTGTLRVRQIQLDVADPDAERTDFPRRPTGFGEGVPA